MSKSVILAAGEKINPLVPHTAELIVGAIAFTLQLLALITHRTWLTNLGG